MKLFVLSSLLLAASTSASPLSASSPNEENTASPTNVTSHFVKVKDVCVATEHSYSTPAVVLVGTSNQLLRCLHENPEQCEVLYTTGKIVSSVLVIGEFIYAGLYGEILRCNLYQAESCVIFQTCDTHVQSLATGNGNLYAGLERGKVLICALDEFNSCRLFHTFERSVYALMLLNEYVYVGVWTGKVMRCSLGTNSSCTLLRTLSEGIMGFSIAGNSIFAVTYKNKLLKCAKQSNPVESCELAYLSYNYPIGITIFDGVVYTVEHRKNIYICEPYFEFDLKWLNGSDCTTYGNINNSYSIAFSYATYHMQSRYRNENTACTWQSESQCPPVVTYYDARQRAKLEVHVKDGKLHNAQGTLVDTSDADVGHAGPAAIFAMGPDGRILLSNLYKKGLLHTSSFFAGNPVAGAGEMVVKNGKIQEIRACSEHYQPDTDLNRQVIKSLKAQGYTDHIKSVMCSESDYNQSESNVQ